MFNIRHAAWRVVAEQLLESLHYYKPTAIHITKTPATRDQMSTNERPIINSSPSTSNRRCLKIRMAFRLKVMLLCCKPSRNHCFVIGVVLGLLIAICLPDEKTAALARTSSRTTLEQHDADSSHISVGCPQHRQQSSASPAASADFEPHLNLAAKPMAAKKTAKNIIRPRYYTSELGIREKLFLGVFTAQDRIDTLATAVNRTAAHLVDKIKFFINADNVRANFGLKNIVGFTDTRANLRPFHVLKYIADNYINDYDYFVLITDEVYADVRRLLAGLQHLSVSFDVYMGRGVRFDTAEQRNQHWDADGAGGNEEMRRRAALGDGRYCDMEAGVVLSSSVIRKIRANLDWCVRSAVTSGHSLNVGRCVLYSTQVGACQERFQVKAWSFCMFVTSFIVGTK